MFHIGNRVNGAGSPCYITFEIGPTHDGVDSARRLIKHAAEAGADAVKFQIFDPDRLVSDKQQLFSYGILKDRETGEIEIVEEPLYEILKRRCLTNNEWRDVKSYSDELGMSFFSTVGFDEDIDFLEEIGCDSIKIASADVNYFPLLRHAANTGMCIQLDTGMATLEEIASAVEVIRRTGNENIIIHQCPSGYPARLESVNLNIITTLKKMFPYPVAFSDHTPGWEMDVAAVALGASLVEKTITEDRMTPSVEHVMSIEPSDMKKFIQTIRDVEVGLGKDRRELFAEEIMKRDKVRRSVFLRSDAKSGQRLFDCDVEFRRPGHGLGPDRFEEMDDAVLVCDLSAGQMVKMEHLEWPEKQ